MTKVARGLLTSIPIAVVVYCAIAAFLVVSDRHRELEPGDQRLDFGELVINYDGQPDLKTFAARDGTGLTYRLYPAKSERILILLHGSGWHSSYFLPLAEFISSEGLAQVYTPDLRGHGVAPERRGDIDYIDQLEDDLADFIAMVRRDNPDAVLVMGGHSSGGGLAVRFAGSNYGQQAHAYLLLSPWLKYNAPTIRPDDGGWAHPYIGRIIGLTMLNNVGIRWFNHLKVISFDMPMEVRDGTETLSYSYRLNTGYAPRDYKKDLRAVTQPLLVLVGTADEVFFADQFEAAISPFAAAQVRLAPDVSHMGVVVNPAVRPVIREWLESIGKPGRQAFG